MTTTSIDGTTLDDFDIDKSVFRPTSILEEPLEEDFSAYQEKDIPKQSEDMEDMEADLSAAANAVSDLHKRGRIGEMHM